MTRHTLFTRPFVALAVADLAYFLGIGVAIYTLPLYVTGPVGSDEAGAGIAFGAFGVTALLARPFVGRYSDRHGRRGLLVFGALLAAVTMAAIPLTESLSTILLLRLAQGVAEAAFFVASYAALADLSPPDRLGEALSYNSLGLYLGLGVGPVLGELLVRTGGFDLAWMGSAALGGLAALLVVFIGETRSVTADTGAHVPLIHVPSIAPSLGFLASLIAVGGFTAFAALHAEEIGMGSTSLALLVYGLVVVVCRVIFAKVPDRLPPLPLAAASLVGISVGLGLAALWQTPAGFLIGAALMGVGVTFSTPAFFAAVFATASENERGAASGTASAFIDLGMGAGPILLGMVARSAGIPTAFAVGAAVALMGTAWTLHLNRVRRAAALRSG